MEGAVVRPGNPAYDWLRRPFNARFDSRLPAAVVRCRSVDDVVAVLRFARRHGLEVAPRGGGHCFAGNSSTPGIVLDATELSAVETDEGLVTVGAGSRLGDLSRKLGEHGLAVPSGSCPSVGIAGLTLGGGFGILGRRYGLTCDSLVAAQVVLADGRIVVTDERREPDLFWALRGAGPGHLGVVTSLTLRTLPARPMTNFCLTWSHNQAAAVVDAWQQWAPNAADELVAELALEASGDVGEPPEARLYGAFLGGCTDALGLLSELVDRAGATPRSERHEELSYRDTLAFQAELVDGTVEEMTTPAGPLRRCGFRVTKSEFFDRPLPAAVIARLVSAVSAGRTAGERRSMEWVPWGGQYARVAPGACAFVHRSHLFSLRHAAAVGSDASPEHKRRAHEWARRCWDSCHPYGSGHVYPNFPDIDLPDRERAYYGDNLPRLRRIKAKYDPENLFRAGQPIALG